MHPPAAEQRQQLPQKLAHQRQRSRVPRLDRHGPARDAVRIDETVRLDGQRAVPIVREPAVHMAEAVLVGDELHVPGSAEGVELLDLGGVERAGRGVHLVVGPVRERVLRVQLDLVDLDRRQAADHGPQRVHGGDLVAGDVEHHAAHGEVGVVAHRARRQSPVVQACQLGERRLAVEEACLVGAGELHGVLADAQVVALCGERRVEPARRGAAVDEGGGELERARDRQEVHASSLR